MLRIMAGLLAPDEGQVIIRGRPREGLLSDEKDPNLKVGMVFQSAALFDSLTVGENVGFKLYEHSDLPDDLIRERIEESLAQVGLSRAFDRYPAQLSGGMKKRAALARAIIKEHEGAAPDDALEGGGDVRRAHRGVGPGRVHGRGGPDAEPPHAGEETGRRRELELGRGRAELHRA